MYVSSQLISLLRFLYVHKVQALLLPFFICPSKYHNFPGIYPNYQLSLRFCWPARIWTRDFHASSFLKPNVAATENSLGISVPSSKLKHCILGVVIHIFLHLTIVIHLQNICAICRKLSLLGIKKNCFALYSKFNFKFSFVFQIQVQLWQIIIKMTERVTVIAFVILVLAVVLVL